MPIAERKEQVSSVRKIYCIALSNAH